MPLGKLRPNRQGATRARGVITSELGQKAKFSLRANVFRYSPNSGHSTVPPSGQVESVSRHLADSGVRYGERGRAAIRSASRIALRQSNGQKLPVLLLKLDGRKVTALRPPPRLRLARSCAIQCRKSGPGEAELALLSGAMCSSGLDRRSA